MPGPGRQNCYAREVLIQCTEDCWVVITSMNPEYLNLVSMNYTAAQISALNVTQTITETATYIPADTLIRFFPTYGYSINFYRVTINGTIRIWIEGNVEGSE